MRRIKIMNCCIIDCTQERLDRIESDEYSTAEIRKFYMEDPETDGITPLISPLCDPAQDNDYGQPSATNKRKKPSFEDSPDSLTGAVETTYDESDSDAAYENHIKECRVFNSVSPKMKTRKSFTNMNESAEALKNILTAREGSVRNRNSKPQQQFTPINAYETCDEYTARYRNDLSEKKDWWSVV